MYDAARPDPGESISFAIPGLDRILIIGDSSAAISFSSKIAKFSTYTKIYNSKEIEGAVKYLKAIKFSVVVIDGDSDFDPISCSRLIGIHNSLARIILISSDIDQSTIVKMKNNGVIHAFIATPSDTIYAHTIIVQEQSKYHINQTLGLLLQDPPNASALYRKINESPLNKKEYSNYLLIAVSIVHETISKYNIIIDSDFEIDPVLFSSYFSALNIFSEKLIHKNTSIESFNFNDQEVFIKSIDEVQYIFVFKYVTSENRGPIEQLVNNIAQRLYLAHGEDFKINDMINRDADIKEVINLYLPKHQRHSFMEADEKAQIVNIFEPNKTLADFYDETGRAYEVHYVDNEEQLFDMINNEDYEMVIFNNFAKDFSWNKYLLNIVKDESPFTQCIAIIDSMAPLDLSNILNVNELDFVVDVNSPIEFYFDLFKKSIEKSKAIQEGVFLSDLDKVYRMKNRPELIKAMLRRRDDSFGEFTIPNFQALFIMIQTEKFYSYYRIEEHNLIKSNEDLFFGFIDSLLNFTDELRNSPLMFSGIKFGNSNIILLEVFEYHYIYFVEDLDQSNYDYVHNILKKLSQDIYEVVKYDINPYVLSDGLDQVLDQLCSEINPKFESIKTVDMEEL